MKYHVLKEEAGQNLLAYLRKKLPPSLSTKAIKRGIDAKACFVNKRLRSFSNYKMTEGDLVEWHNPIQSLENLEVKVIFEDEDLLAIDKPSRILSDEAGIRKLMNRNSIYLVHRLDKETSGILLLAKNEAAKTAMEKLFEERKVHKTYYALVLGFFPKEEMTSDNYLPQKREKEEIGRSKKVKPPHLHAVTKFSCKLRSPKASLVKCQPKTGRMHQIRMHLHQVGFPILGDYYYAPKAEFPVKVTRHLLHAFGLRFPHPMSGRILDLRATIPADFMEAAKTLLGDGIHSLF